MWAKLIPPQPHHCFYVASEEIKTLIFQFTSMANLISIFLTFFLFSLSKISLLSFATAVVKDQVSCSMCSACDNPCQLPPPPPPPPVVDCPPPPPPPSPPPPLPTSQCPPPPSPPSCDTCVYPSPPPPSSVQPYPPADGGQFPGLAPPPPNPILPYFPYYYYTPPSASAKSFPFSWKFLPLPFLIILFL
ncbi:unnamed protein product [Citrullus colocynthis]|uniref:Leucine-rich repeat extensin-like protein 3 n=1 Tax=Citrullus colocynthis TaxID=252529 RepID=A0ABP0XTA2_9ROSI